MRVGQAILESLNLYARAPCGYATLHSVIDKSQEDRMESFFLSETCKYLYLVTPCSISLHYWSLISLIFAQLFDIHHPINQFAERYLFTTEGHIIPITPSLRSPDWDDEEDPHWRLPSSRSRKSHFRHVSPSKSDVVALPSNSTHSVVSIY